MDDMNTILYISLALGGLLAALPTIALLAGVPGLTVRESRRP